MKALNTTMAVWCVTVSLPNHNRSYYKMQRLFIWKEFVHHSHVFNSLHNKNKAIQNRCAYFATRIRLTFFLLFKLF